MIECIKYHEINKGHLQGIADLWIEKMGLEIFGCKVFYKNGTKWLNLPQRSYKDGEETKYAPVVRFRIKAHHEAFQQQAIEAIDRWKAEQVTTPTQSVFKEDEDIPF